MKDVDLTNLEAYDLLDVKDIPALDVTGYTLVHKKTKARIALLLNDDSNKVFNIAFRTPCSDDTGVPHIMEHSVLCGSDKYPVKDPFVELAKGSLNTFLNAMTSSIMTMYPVASCNNADFKNLMDVYMDAVFHPNIYKHKEIFEQEGWSYKLDSKEDELKISGVVYNEMKGAFSSPDSMLFRYILHTIFPDNQYKYESGGDPKYIPELTYEAFVDFHKKYYHPSNSFIYLYGDIDAVERLEYMDKEYLSKYDYLKVDSEILEQKPFDKVREARKTYSIGDNECEKDKTYVAYTSTFGKGTDAKIYYAMNILDYALVAMPGAPVKKALVESGLCKDVLGGGVSSKDNFFTFIAKGANEADKDKIVKVIDDTLRRLVDEGLDKESLRAALNVYEFKYREADYGSNSKGLFYGLDMLNSWMFDELHPFTLIDADNIFIYLKSVVETGYFESLIEEFLLRNTHKVIFTFVPEKGLTKKVEEELSKRLADYKATLSDSELQKIIDNNASLTKYQSEPNTQEELKCLPLLKLSDIDKASEKVEYCVNEEAGIKVIHSNLFTGNIAYITASFNTENIPQELIPYVGLLENVIGFVDTDKHSYVELNNMINIHSGGMETSSTLYRDCVTAEKYKLSFEAKIKVFYDKIDKAFEILKEILMESKVDDKKRIKEIVEELKAGFASSSSNSGNSYAVKRASSYFGEGNLVNDMISGVEFMWFVEELAENFDEKADEIIANLKKTIDKIFNINNITLSFTASEEGYGLMKEPLAGFVSSLKTEECQREPRSFEIGKKNEGLKTPGQVQFVCRAGNFKIDGFEYTGTLRALSNFLDYGFLWENVRVKGGAYGCMSGYSDTGNVYFVSYRDPNLAETNDIFESIPEYLRSFNASDRDLLKYIIGTISTLDRPKTARIKGDTALGYYMRGKSNEMAQKERDEILALSNENIRKMADIIEAVLAQGNICVVGNAGKIDENESMFMSTKDLLK